MDRILSNIGFKHMSSFFMAIVCGIYLHVIQRIIFSNKPEISYYIILFSDGLKLRMRAGSPKIFLKKP